MVEYPPIEALQTRRISRCFKGKHTITHTFFIYICCSIPSFQLKFPRFLQRYFRYLCITCAAADPSPLFPHFYCPRISRFSISGAMDEVEQAKQLMRGFVTAVMLDKPAVSRPAALFPVEKYAHMTEVVVMQDIVSYGAQYFRGFPDTPAVSGRIDLFLCFFRGFRSDFCDFAAFCSTGL